MRKFSHQVLVLKQPFRAAIIGYPDLGSFPVCILSHYELCFIIMILICINMKLVSL